MEVTTTDCHSSVLALWFRPSLNDPHSLCFSSHPRAVTTCKPYSFWMKRNQKIPIYKVILTFMWVSSHCGAQGSQNSTSYEFSPSLSIWNLTVCHSVRFIGHLKWSRNWTVAFSGLPLPWVRDSVVPPSTTVAWGAGSVAVWHSQWQILAEWNHWFYLLSCQWPF